MTGIQAVLTLIARTIYRMAFLLCFLAAAGFANAQNIVYKDAKSTLEIGHEVFLLADTAGTFSIEEVSAGPEALKFRPGTSAFTNFPASQIKRWCKFTVENQSGQELYLEISNGVLHYIDFYSPKEGGGFELIKTGALRPFESRPFDSNFFMFFLTDKGDRSPKTFYIRLDSQHPIEIPLKVGSMGALEKEKSLLDFFVGGFAGIMVVMSFYNFFLYLSLRDRLYLIYIGFLISVGTSALFFVGNYAFYFIWKDWEQLNYYPMVYNFVAYTFIFLFLNSFLGLKKHAPKLRIALIGNAALLALLASLNLGGLYVEIADLHQLAIFVHLILCLSAALYCLKKHKMSHARYYIQAWLLYFISVVAYVLALNGVLPANFFTKYGLLIGVASEATLFSIALANRINILKEQTLSAQAEALSQAKQNEEIVKDQNEKLNLMVKEKTDELMQSNEELLQSNEELGATLTQLNEQTLFVKKQHEDITASINYAKRIQAAMLPPISAFDKYFGKDNFFIFYRPRDIVSGDFYWLERVGDTTFLALADCTGHGVPGAFMSLVAGQILYETICLKNVYDPHEILEELDSQVRRVLNQQDSNSKDGLDIVMLRIQDNVVAFAGATNKLYAIQNGNMEVFKGTRRSIGGDKDKPSDKPFEMQEIPISQNGLYLYLTTDGFVDQFGGNDGRTKFLAKRFSDMLLTVQEMPLAEQVRHAEEVFLGWKGVQKQIDDVSLVGLHLFRNYER